ncbi:MAG: EAL domain-containing protein [Thiohalorhabdus sp.]|uniref:sensor domain-containing protein n=1 Tax=Thiohalorhabdus sp. TaxID=3094134 RepID=UPI002FC33462
MASLEQAISRRLIQETPNALVVIDTDQRICYANPPAERIFGYAQGELLDQPLDLLLPPESRKAHREHIQRFLASEDRTRSMGERGEIRGLHADGTPFPAEATITRLEWEGSTYLVALLNDRSSARELEAERQRLAEILESTPDLVGIADPEGNVVYRNKSARDLLASPLSERDPRPHVQAAHPKEDGQRVLNEAFPEARETGFWEGENTFLNGDGNHVPVSQIIRAHYDGNGEVAYFSTIARDLRPYREAEHRLHILFAALDQAADMVWITDNQGVVEYVNPAFEAVTGFAAEAAKGHKVGALMKSGHHDQDFYARMWGQLLQGQPYRDVFTNRTRDGQEVHIDETISPVRDSDGKVTHFIATGRDISERLVLEDRLRQLAYYDPLTGLPNRTHFEEQLAHSLSRAERSGHSLALLMLDLDRFKDLNDSLGHPTGDELLVQVGHRLREAVRSSDLVARLGGDEFVILLDPVAGEEGVIRVAETLLQALEPRFDIQGTAFHTHISIGISLFPADAEDTSTLLQQADTALFEAKGAGGHSYRFFSPRHTQAATDRFQVEHGLHQALAEEACEPFFQPLVRLPTGAIIGVEALVRCRFPDSGEWIPPGRFISVAERTGLIHQLGAGVLKQACQAFRDWWAKGYSLERLAVNLSPIQLTRRGFSTQVAAILEETGVAPGWLELEITEEAVLWDEEIALEELEALAELGVVIALDDFGKGYSSPANLQQLPVSRMKIDRAFIQGVDHDPGNRTILRGLLGFAEGFRCRITAEGIERPEEAAYLRGLGIQEGQGFLYAHPLRAHELERTFLAGD